MSEPDREGNLMASVHLVSTSPRQFESVQRVFCSLRSTAGRSVYLMGMDTVNQRLTPPDETESVVTLSQLADELCVPVKYDLRSKGRGPRGFRVGRELRFRRREVDAWLTHLESADARRHPRQEPA